MSKARRVVVTGIGLVTPLGVNVPTSWSRLLNGDSGISYLEESSVGSKVAAKVPCNNGKALLPVSKYQEKQLPRYMRFALDSAHQALQDSNWFPSSFQEKVRTGVCVGSGIGSTEEIATASSILEKEGPRRVSPYFIPRLLVNLAAGHISIKYGFHGPNHTVSTACTTGAHAIGDASRFIQFGDADVMVAGGSEACINPLSLAGFSQLRALSTKYNKTPETASRPFDRDRDGFVIGEGSGCVVLEEYEHAKARGAKIYAELTGYGLSGDAHHITSPSESGLGAVLAMKAALRNANLDPDEVDYINAHATSTPSGDLVETRAINQVFGSKVAVSSTKGAIGHLLGAAGAVEAIFTILAVKNNILPANLNLENLASLDEYSLDYIRETRYLEDVERRNGKGTGTQAALTNSFGFGGTNASLLFQKNRQLPPNHYYSTLGAKTKELVKCIEDATNFEQDSTNFLATYGNDSVISSFVSEYQKVLHVIKRSKNKCVSLLSKAEGLEMEYAQHEHNSVNIEKLQSDSEKSQALRTQINRAEITLLSYAKREEQSKDEIRQLRQDVSNLTMTIKQGVGLSPAQEKAINELVLMKEQTSKELQAEMEKITTFRTSITGMSEKIEAMEKEQKEIDRETATLKEKNAAKKIEIDVELGTKEKFERDLRELRVIVTIKSQEAVAKQAAVSRLIEDITSIDSQIKQQKAQIEKLLRDQELLGTRTVKLQQDYNEQMVFTNELSQQNEVALGNLKVKERELARQKNEAKLIMRTKETLVKKSRILEDRKTEEENDRRVLKEHNSALFLAIQQKKRKVEIAKKTIEELNHENDILKAGLKKAQNETMKLSNLLVLQKQHEATLELDIARSVRDVALNEKKIEQLSEEKEKLTAESSHIANQSMATLTELKNFEIQIYEYKRQSLQAENKLKYQQNLYEAVQSDRKLHSKQLIESQAEIADMKRNLKIMNFQINGFKEEANSKNSLFIKESEALLKLSKDSEIIKDEIKQLKSQNELAHAYIKTQMIEEFKLEQFVKEAEVEKERQQKALNVVLAEKENLSSQLLTRNQELNTIYNKIKTQNLELLRGEMHFRSKMREIHALREKTLKIRMQAAEAQIETETLTPMKHLTVKLRKQITQSQARIKALEEELENPINIHRWRKLEGSQPQTYAMLQLLHTLQKKLIQKTKEEFDKGRAIEEKEKLYLHLKAVLAKQSGPETQIQIQEFRKVVKEKKLQLRHMETELNMYKSQVKEYKHTIEAIDAGLADCKSQFLKMYQKKARDMQNQGSASPATFMEEQQIDDNESFNGVHFEEDVQIIENDVSDNEDSGSDDFMDDTGENSLLGAGLATIVGE